MIRWDRSRDFLDVLVPIRYHGTEMGVIRLGIDTLPLVQQKQSIYYSSFLLTIISCLIVILIGFVATRSVIQPLEELVETVRRFGEGDLEIRSRIETNDEIETLSRQFNDMARGIKERIEERERSLQQLEAVQKAGTRISRTRGSDVFFEVLDEVLQTLYELDTVRVFLWDGAVFQLVHSRPDHDGPLYLDYGDPPVDMLEKVSEPTPISPDENWPDALQVTNWVIPLSVGEELNGALYLELSENLDEREQAWMNIWQTQIAHAVRAMVQEQKLESFYGDPLELERAILDRAMDEGYDTFGLISIPDLSKHVEQEGILYRETLIDDFRRVLENEGWSCDISPLGFDTILVPCRNLNDFDRTSLENQLREACDLDVDIRWLKGDAESVDAVLFSVKSL